MQRIIAWMCLRQPELAVQDLERAREIESKNEGLVYRNLLKLAKDILLALQQDSNNRDEIITAFGRKNVAAMRQQITQETERN